MSLLTDALMLLPWELWGTKRHLDNETFRLNRPRGQKVGLVKRYEFNWQMIFLIVYCYTRRRSEFIGKNCCQGQKRAQQLCYVILSHILTWYVGFFLSQNLPNMYLHKLQYSQMEPTVVHRYNRVLINQHTLHWSVLANDEEML